MDYLLTFVSSIAFVLIGLILVGLIMWARTHLVNTGLVKLRINENDELTKEVSGGGTLLETLAREGIAVPSPCGGKATCKQCRVRVVDGGGDILETDRATFSPKELKEGWRLSCQCKVKSDMGLKLPDSVLTLREFEARVVSNENVATFIKELVVEIDEEIEYQPGDYLQFHVPPFKTNTTDWKETMDEHFYSDWEKFHMFDQTIDFTGMGDEVIRAYSMASYPLEGKTLRFNIRIASPPFKNGAPDPSIPWGICSAYTFGLKPGDKIKLSGPFGESHMIDDGRELVFLIGGAGSSFGRSHILDLFLRRDTDRKLTMWYGARSLKENIYEKEYRDLDAAHDNFSYKLVLSEPLPEDNWPTDDPIQTGFLFKAFEKGQLEKMDEPEEALYYVCGPPMHNLSVMKLLDEYGVPRESVILDDFGS